MGNISLCDKCKYLKNGYCFFGINEDKSRELNIKCKMFKDI